MEYNIYIITTKNMEALAFKWDFSGNTVIREKIRSGKFFRVFKRLLRGMWPVGNDYRIAFSSTESFYRSAVLTQKLRPCTRMS